MIGKIITGKSFRGCLLYCLNDKLRKHLSDEAIFKNRAEILLFNKCFGNQKELIQQFKEVRQLNPKLSKPVLHITLSFAKGEQLDNNKLSSICEACAKALGFENNQYLAVLHKDTGHQHLHIVANRVGFDKRSANDSNNYQKIAKFCRKMELKYTLQQVLSPRKFLSKEQRLLPRQDERKQRLKSCIGTTLIQSKTYYQFERMMKEQGYKVIKGRGISFIDDKKVKIKGSEVEYSLGTINKILEQQDRLKLAQNNSNQFRSLKYSGQLQNNQPETLCPLQKSVSVADQFTIDMAQIIEQVIKPEETQQHLSFELLRKKKQKKKRGLHL